MDGLDHPKVEVCDRSSRNKDTSENPEKNRAANQNTTREEQNNFSVFSPVAYFLKKWCSGWSFLVNLLFLSRFFPPAFLCLLTICLLKSTFSNQAGL